MLSMFPLSMLDGGTFVPSLLAQGGDSLWQRFWFRETGSPLAEGQDNLFFYIFWISLVFFIPLVILPIYWGVKYRRRAVGEVSEVSASHNTALELTWSIIPTILFAVMFFWGFYAYMERLIAPADSETMYATAFQWGWEFEYPDGGSTLETELIGEIDSPVIAFPVDTSFKMVMTSKDVIHSFYIPAFRIKRDIFPNRYTTVWFRTSDRVTHVFNDADGALTPVDDERPGYYLFCAEYCGDQHSQMAARVAVLSDVDYAKWREQQGDTSGIDLLELGETLYKAKGCNACHSVDGRRLVGPTWKDVWNEPRPGWVPPSIDAQSSPDEMEAKVNFNYVRDSILNPKRYIVSGYPNQMQSYAGQLTERELRAIAIYMMSLTPEFEAEAKALSAQEMAEREAGSGDADSAGDGDAETSEDAAGSEDAPAGDGDESAT